MKTLESFPEYVTAVGRLNEMQTELNAAQREREKIITALNSGAKRAKTLADEAMAYLDGEAQPDRTDGHEALRKANDRLQLLGEATRIQKDRMEKARAAASKIICDGARAEFCALVRAELKAAHALLTAQEARRSFWSRLSDAGASMAWLPPTAPVLKGSLDDPSNMFWQRVDDAIALGYLKVGEFTPPPPPPEPERLRVGLRISAGPNGIQESFVSPDGKVTKKIFPAAKPGKSSASAWLQ